MARYLSSALLTLTMQSQPQLSLDSYDRLFPDQDTLPKGGFGNLIASPLQCQRRTHGNRTFMDINNNYSLYQDTGHSYKL